MLSDAVLAGLTLEAAIEGFEALETPLETATTGRFAKDLRLGLGLELVLLTEGEASTLLAVELR